MKTVSTLFLLITFFSGFSQRGKEELNSVAAGACECIRKLDVNLSLAAKNDSIQSCIMTQNLVSLVKQTMMPVGKDSIKNVIIANQDYDEIQQLLRDHCPALKNLLEADNKKYKFSHSDNPKAMEYYKKGQDFDGEQKYEKAIGEYKKAIKLDQNFAFAWDNMGKDYRNINKYNEAIDCYKKSLALDPEGMVPMQNMAIAQELLKDYTGAAKTYEQLIVLHPDDPEGFYGASRMYYVGESYEKALDNMFRAYSLYKETKSPYMADAENSLSIYYQKLKELNQLDLFRKMAKKHNINTTE